MAASLNMATAAVDAAGFEPRVAPAAVQRVVMFTLVAVALSCPLVAVAPTGLAIGLDTAQQVGATIGATVALVTASRHASARQRHLIASLGLGLALAGMGMLVWRAVPEASPTAAVAGGLFLLALCLVGVSVGRAFAAIIDPGRLGPLVLDGLIMAAATGCVMSPIWRSLVGDSAGPAMRIAALLAVGAVAGPMGGFLVLYDRRLQIGMWGPFAALAGLMVGGLSWIAWLVLVVRGEAAPVAAVDYGYSLGVLLLAWGGITWDRPPRPHAILARLSAVAVDALPLGAVAAVMLLVLFDRGDAGPGAIDILATAVVGLALLRQWLLAHTERTARRHEAESAARLVAEVAHRVDVLGVLARLEAGATPEETADRICTQAAALAGIHEAAIAVFEPDGGGFIIAAAGVRRLSETIDPVLSADRTAHLRGHAAGGAWFESIVDRPEPHLQILVAEGVLGMAYGAVVASERILGVIAMGSTLASSDPVVAERLVTVREFGVLAGALLGRGLEERSRRREIRGALERVIEDRAFHIVFQPIVRLADRCPVGYEALTRFADGTRPDVRFDEAASVGLGIELEWATLRAAIHDSHGLRAGTYLSLNVSPELACNVTTLEAMLETAGRGLVVEITEHTAVKDYNSLRTGLQALRGHARIAVDDAGSGYAGLQHMLEIGPDIVKLDIALVRSVDSDPGRQALIASMVGFANQTGAVLVAEGVETEAEAATLEILGITLGQGYLFGRPEPAATAG
jgi:EAL domain-containing protein (putative c-di-GMP-specific phosphodiesterase class I)